jgi:hypothetical protein
LRKFLMKKLFFRVLIASALVTASASAWAGELKLTIANGRVTLIAQEVPLRQILTEWARVGETRIVNAEKLVGPPLTLQLVDVPEKEALDIVLHSASGYVAAPRAASASGASQYDRIMILATSRAPAVSASGSTPPPFTRPQMPQPPIQPPVDDDDGEPGDQGPVPPPGMLPTTMPQPGMMPATGIPPTGMPPQPGMQPQPYPGVLQQPGQQQVPMTAPRPGMLPTPTPGTPGNPYQPYPQQAQPPQQPPRRPGGGGL